jgi:hypothetical protein
MSLKGLSVNLKKRITFSFHDARTRTARQMYPTDITEVRHTVLNVDANNNKIQAPLNPLQVLKYHYTTRIGNTNLI